MLCYPSIDEQEAQSDVRFSGGTVKEGVIEIQGDHIERILDYLKKQGVRAKRAGG